MTEEIWKDIKGYEGLYQVSDRGRVRSVDRIVNYKNGWKINKKGIIRTHNRDKYGYDYIGLHNQKIERFCKIHRLVAQAFIPNPDNKPQVNHINGVKTDNRVENLEWCTAKENKQHAVKNGMVGFGERAGNHLLDADSVKVIREIYKTGAMTITEISKSYNFSRAGIADIIKERSWKHLL